MSNQNLGTPFGNRTVHWQIVRKWILFAAISLTLLAALGVLVTARSSGVLVPDTVINNPTVCARSGCHVGPTNTLNDLGQVEILNVPDIFELGESYDLQLRITGPPSTARFGFQVTAFFESDETQAGNLSATTPGTVIFSFRGVDHLTHQFPLLSGEIGFRWTAPTGSGERVVIRVAANSANNNGTTSGDHISSAEVITQGTPPPFPDVDLQIEVVQQEDPPILGADYTVTYQVLNNGPDQASGVEVDELLPVGVVFVDGSEGCVASPEGMQTRVICSLGILDNGAGAEAEVTVNLQQAGAIERSALVRSELPDPIDTNDTVSYMLLVIDDVDEDGVTDALENAGPNDGDGNMDGTPDSQQGNVASLPDLEGRYVTVEAAEGHFLRNVANATDLGPDTPLGVLFPFGLTFQVQLPDEPAPAGEAATIPITVRIPAGVVVDTFYNFGPTAEVAEPHFYPFLFDGQSGAEIMEDRIVLHYQDGLRGDDDLTADGTIQVGAALAAQQLSVFYFPQIAVGISQALGVVFDTELVFVNTGQATPLIMEFRNSAGEPLPVDVQTGDEVFLNLVGATLEVGAGETVLLRLASTTGIRAGYAVVQTSGNVGGTAVFNQTSTDLDFQSGVPATTGLTDFSLAVQIESGFSDTGLALVNVSQGPGMTLAEARDATITLRLYDLSGNLVDEAELELLAGSHLPRFVSQLLENVPEDFLGSLTVESDQPLAAITLRQTNIPTLTTFPVISSRFDSEP